MSAEAVGRSSGRFCSSSDASSRSVAEYEAGSSGGGSSVQIFMYSAGATCAVKGGESAHSSWITTPSDQMSQLRVHARA